MGGKGHCNTKPLQLISLRYSIPPLYTNSTVTCTHAHPTSCLVQVQVARIKISQFNHRMILHHHSSTASPLHSRMTLSWQGDQHQSLVITAHSQQAITMANRLPTAIITHTASHPVDPIRIMIHHTTISTRAMITTVAIHPWTAVI